MIEKNKSWHDYLDDSGLNGSKLALILESPAHLRHCVDEGIGPQQKTTRVGTGLHSLVEALPDVNVEQLWRVMPDFTQYEDNQTATGKRSYAVTDWVREQQKLFRKGAAADGIDVLDEYEHRRIIRMLRSIAKCADAMDLIVASDREVSVTDVEIEGVVCKGRIDGLCQDYLQWNLKCCGRGIGRREFGYVESDYHYTFKDAFHRMMLRECGVKATEFRYILVDDCQPWKPPHEHAGKFARPPQCIVVDVPITVFESMEDTVREKLKLYRQCCERNDWPGILPYTYVPYAMEELTLVD